MAKIPEQQGLFFELDGVLVEQARRNEDGSINEQQQYDNYVKWLKETDVVKPGNLMWKANGGGIGELIDNDGNPAPLTDEEIHYLATYLQTLK